MYFQTDDPKVIERLSKALLNAEQLGRRVRLDVSPKGTLRYKIGEGMWSAPVESTTDPYRDETWAGRTETVYLKPQG